MRRLECDICLQDIEDYYDTTVNIIDNHQRLLTMATENPHGAKLLSAGRVVILRDGVSKRRLVKNLDRPGRRCSRIPAPTPQHFKSDVGVLLKPAPTQASVGSKMYWVLAVVDSHTKSGKNGEMVDGNRPGPKAHD